MGIPAYSLQTTCWMLLKEEVILGVRIFSWLPSASWWELLLPHTYTSQSSRPPERAELEMDMMTEGLVVDAAPHPPPPDVLVLEEDEEGWLLLVSGPMQRLV